MPFDVCYSSRAGYWESGCRWETIPVKTKTKIVGVKKKLLDELFNNFMNEMNIRLKKTKLRKIK
jgi:hypothetical protein